MAQLTIYILHFGAPRIDAASNTRRFIVKVLPSIERHLRWIVPQNIANGCREPVSEGQWRGETWSSAYSFSLGMLIQYPISPSVSSRQRQRRQASEKILSVSARAFPAAMYAASAASAPSFSSRTSLRSATNTAGFSSMSPRRYLSRSL